jgi:hypothetical protein
MTEKAFHVTLLVVHAIFVSRKIFRTMALNTVDDFFRRRPFRGLPSSVKVFVERVHHGIDDLPLSYPLLLIMCSMSWRTESQTKFLNKSYFQERP